MALTVGFRASTRAMAASSSSVGRDLPAADQVREPEGVVRFVVGEPGHACPPWGASVDRARGPSLAGQTAHWSTIAGEEPACA